MGVRGKPSGEPWGPGGKGSPDGFPRRPAGLTGRALLLFLTSPPRVFMMGG